MSVLVSILIPAVPVPASRQPRPWGRARAGHSTPEQEGGKMGSRSTEESEPEWWLESSGKEPSAWETMQGCHRVSTCFVVIM